MVHVGLLMVDKAVFFLFTFVILSSIISNDNRFNAKSPAQLSAALSGIFAIIYAIGSSLMLSPEQSGRVSAKKLAIYNVSHVIIMYITGLIMLAVLQGQNIVDKNISATSYLELSLLLSAIPMAWGISGALSYGSAII